MCALWKSSTFNFEVFEKKLSTKEKLKSGLRFSKGDPYKLVDMPSSGSSGTLEPEPELDYFGNLNPNYPNPNTSLMIIDYTTQTWTNEQTITWRTVFYDIMTVQMF